MLFDGFILYECDSFFFLDNASDSFNGTHLYLFCLFVSLVVFFFFFWYADLNMFLVTLGDPLLYPQLG